MIKALRGSTLILMISGSAVAQEGRGFACFDDTDTHKIVVAIHQADGGHVAVMDGDMSNPMPAEWNDGGDPLASIEGKDFLAVLDADKTLNILSKSEALTSFTCIDVTDAAHTLNSEFGVLSDLTERASELESDLAETITEAERNKALLAAANRELDEEEALSADSQRRVAALNEQVATLRSELGRLQNLLNIAEDAEADSQLQIESLTQDLNSAVIRALAAERRARELGENLPDDELSEAQERIADLKGERYAAVRALDAAEQQIEALKEERELDIDQGQEAALQRLEEEIERLESRNEQLIQNSRRWQDEIAELKEVLSHSEQD